ncbi:unnamed protein product, partial [Notodromas monacha]
MNTSDGRLSPVSSRDLITIFSRSRVGGWYSYPGPTVVKNLESVCDAPLRPLSTIRGLCDSGLFGAGVVFGGLVTGGGFLGLSVTRGLKVGLSKVRCLLMGCSFCHKLSKPSSTLYINKNSSSKHLYTNYLQQFLVEIQTLLHHRNRNRKQLNDFFSADDSTAFLKCLTAVKSECEKGW